MQPFVITVVGFAVMTFLMVAVVTIVVRRWFVARDMVNGVRATGVVLSAQAGAWSVRQGAKMAVRMTMEVEILENGESWVATIKQLVSPAQTVLCRVGARVAVKYDPHNRSRAVLDPAAAPAGGSVTNVVLGGADVGSLVSAALAQQGLGGGSFKVVSVTQEESILGADAAAAWVKSQGPVQGSSAPQDIVMQVMAAQSLFDSLASSGVTASASVIDSQSVFPNYVEGVDFYRLKVWVSPAQAPAFETILMALVLRASAYKVEPGRDVLVKYDPTNPQRAALLKAETPQPMHTF